MNDAYHVPVLLNAVIDGLQIRPEGTYVDATYGGGGHSGEILKALNNQGKLYAFDQDKDAVVNTTDDARFTFIPSNFRFLKNHLKMHQATPVDGILADLGVSSHQFNTTERGFSLRFDATLDMRMDQGTTSSAREVVNDYNEADLVQVFRGYGELKEARKIARRLVNARTEKTLRTTRELCAVLKGMAPPHKENQFLARVFQALRIEVNKELEALKTLMEQACDVLKPEGRLAVISYHSLEDRLVKNYFRSGNFDGKQEKDFYGNLIRPMHPIQTKPIVPDQTEIQANNRARSARLRIAEKRK